MMLFCGCSNSLQLQRPLNALLFIREFIRRYKIFLLLYENMEAIPEKNMRVVF